MRAPHLLLLLFLAACSGTTARVATQPEPVPPEVRVPEWAADAVWYQIFPERFRNGDPSNDPTHQSLELPIERVPASWTITPWTSDWYARADWEREIGDDFYRHGVFDRRYGGDLQGVIDQLDYLSGLGVNALYFNPVFWARSLHKYDGNSFHHIDPHFGPDPAGDFALMEEETSDPSTWHWTAADRLFLDLVRQAHDRGIRVIIDGVWNHTGRDFFAFADIMERQEASPYVDWYYVNAFDDPDTPENEFDYEGWWGVHTLPVFADTPDGTDLHPGPKQYVFDATTRWMDPNEDGDPSDGIDGWRLDVANEVPIQFWNDWNAHVRSLNPEAYTVTEIWHDAAEFLSRGGFSATMNYHGFAFPTKGFLIDNAMQPSVFVDTLNARRSSYEPRTQHALQNVIDSHDTDRLASMIVNAGRHPYMSPDRFDYDIGERVSPRHYDRYDVRAPNAREKEVQRLVTLFHMTYVGAPMVYYGSESGMWGADDPGDRKPMVWPDMTYDVERADPLGRPRQADPVAFDHDLFTYYRNVIALRNENATLRRGGFEVLMASEEQNILAFQRLLGDDITVVILNRSDEAHSMRIDLPERSRGQYETAFVTHDEGWRFQQDASALLIELPSLGGMVVRRE